MNERDVNKLVSMIVQNLRSAGHHDFIEIIKKSDRELRPLPYNIQLTVESTNGCEFAFYLEQSDYDTILFSISEYEDLLLNIIRNLGYADKIYAVKLIAKLEYVIDWMALPQGVDKTYILELLDWERNTLIATGTGESIKDHEKDYEKHHKIITQLMNDMCLDHVNNFSSLWSWYTYYSENLETYATRRAYVAEMYDPLIKMIESSDEIDDNLIEYIPTGWTKIDYDVSLMRNNLYRAQNEIEYQTVGIHGRELLLTLAQMVYDKDKHKPGDGDIINSNDSKKMLDAYIRSFSKTVLSEEIIRFAKASIDLANKVTHKRTATKFDSELCYIAVISTVHVINNVSQIEKSKINY